MTKRHVPFVIAGNWKMNNGVEGSRNYIRNLLEILGARKDLERALFEGFIEIVLFPPAVALYAVYTELAGSPLATGAQNVHWETSGAYTGEISVPMVFESGCTRVLVGHSERRHLFGETVEMTRKKFAACRKGGVSPVLCIGETEVQRANGQTEEVLSRQLEGALMHVPFSEEERVYVAYEPVWAIGTGNTATAADAETACRFVRERISRLFGRNISGNTKILYGGSVKPDNASDLLAEENIDGVLVGGASLDPGSFLAIAEAALQHVRNSAT